MSNILAQLNAWRARLSNDQAKAIEVKKTNAVKQEIVESLSEKLAVRKQQEAELIQKREMAELQRKKQMERVVSNCSRAKTLLTDMGDLSSLLTSQTKADSELRAKLAEMSGKMASINENEARLHASVQELREPVSIGSEHVEEIREMKTTALGKLNARRDTFDLTALVAEIQAIEKQRIETAELSEQQRAKSEMLAALELDNESQDEQQSLFTDELAAAAEQSRKIAEENEKKEIGLTTITAEKTALEQNIKSAEADSENIESEITDLTQKKAELDSQIVSKTIELEQGKAQVQEKQRVLDQWKTTVEIEEFELQGGTQMISDKINQQCTELSKLIDSHRKAAEEASAEVERLTQYEPLLQKYEENDREISDIRSKLAEANESRSVLAGKIDEKNAKLADKTSKLESLRKDADLRRQAMGNEIEDVDKKIEEMEGEIRKLEDEAKDVQNQKFELEGEIHLLKHQLSTKTEELTVAKEQYCRMKEVGEIETRIDGFPTREIETASQDQNNINPERVPEKEVKKKSSNRKQKNTPQLSAPSQHGSSRGVPQNINEKKRSEKKDHVVDQQKGRKDKPKKIPKQRRKIKELSFFSTNFDESISSADDDNDEMEIDVDVNKSSSLQHTNTLASMLADEFMDADDSFGIKDDEDSSLFGQFDNEAEDFHTQKTGSLHPSGSSDIRQTPRREDEIHFEPNELLTSTPLIGKRQCTVRPTRSKSSNRSQEPPPMGNTTLPQSQRMLPPLKLKMGDLKTVFPGHKRRGRPHGYGSAQTCARQSRSIATATPMSASFHDRRFLSRSREDGGRAVLQ
ncbi:hypothetical protein Q1695_014793 [Nippostrongylus brasiliensis]|nr:hypothetical protein Q1695_014793 [Nippostrongylus brasiliensis]